MRVNQIDKMVAVTAVIRRDGMPEQTLLRTVLQAMP
jgi:hypothetical protein